MRNINFELEYKSHTLGLIDSLYGQKVTQHVCANYNQRPDNVTIDTIVIHHISLPPEQFGTTDIVDFFQNKLNVDKHPYFASIAQVQVSSHFLITRQGQVHQFVNTYDRAWHAGQSQFLNRSDCNNFSIGIELEGADNIAFTHQQYKMLTYLIVCLQAMHLNISYVTGHAYIAPNRKTDPGKYFDWSTLAHFLHPLPKLKPMQIYV